MTEHTDVGAYALGLLEDDDQRAFEAHLAGCPVCTTELSDLSGMRELLADIEPFDAEVPRADDRDDVVSLLQHRTAAARRRRRRTAIVGAAAGIALLAGGVAIGATVTGNGTSIGGRHARLPSDLLGWGETHRAADPKTGVSGIVAMEGRGWGTHVAVDLTGIRGPLTCELVAVSTSGQRHLLDEWTVPDKGYGVRGAPDHLQVHASTAVARSDLARFEVRAQDGGILLSIPV